MEYKVLAGSELKYKTLIARAVELEDIEYIRKCRNSQKEILRQNYDISKESQLDYYKNIVWPELNSLKPKLILLSLFREGAIIGYGGLVNISWENKRAEVSYVVNSNIKKQDDLYRLNFNDFLCFIKNISFQKLSLIRLYTETYDIRPLHISVLEKNGFQLEGRLASHVIINKKTVDSLIHGCLKVYGKQTNFH